MRHRSGRKSTGQIYRPAGLSRRQCTSQSTAGIESRLGESLPADSESFSSPQSPAMEKGATEDAHGVASPHLRGRFRGSFKTRCPPARGPAREPRLTAAEAHRVTVGGRESRGFGATGKARCPGRATTCYAGVPGSRRRGPIALSTVCGAPSAGPYCSFGRLRPALPQPARPVRRCRAPGQRVDSRLEGGQGACCARPRRRRRRCSGDSAARRIRRLVSQTGNRASRASGQACRPAGRIRGPCPAACPVGGDSAAPPPAPRRSENPSGASANRMARGPAAMPAAEGLSVPRPRPCLRQRP